MLQADLLFADRYRLIKCIGRGGFAEVWLAEDTLADLQVAIKIYGGMDDDGLKIFVKEINKVYHLNHTNLLKPQYVAAWNNMPYLVMTYCAVGSCEKLIGKVTEKEVWKILHDVASGLAYLHNNNIIHQDIKPANILQDDMGNYVIIDFGISTLARDTLRKSTLMGNTSAGTLAYMGPERFSKDSAPILASDIWSLGAMLFELLEGRTPFPPDFGGGMQEAGAEVPDITANVSQELKSVITQMLSLNSWDRPTAVTLVEWSKNPVAIEKLSRPTQRKIIKPAEEPQQPKQPKSNGWIWIIITLLLIAGLRTIGVRKYQAHQLEIAVKEQYRQDSIRQVQIQDSIREVRRQDSIRIEQERIRRQDSIAAEQGRLERLRREAEEAERKRIENEKKRIAEERRRAGIGSHNGHDYVDLGLSVKWATCNVGATSPEGYGNYYAWGETYTKTTYSWSTYKWYNGSVYQPGEHYPSGEIKQYAWTYYKQKKYVTNSGYGHVDNKRQLDLSDDAANANWGGNWRMPTEAEWTELEESCIWTWTSQSGIYGYKVTRDGKSIFIPATGARGVNWQGSKPYARYWASTGSNSDASDFRITANGVGGCWSVWRYCGCSVRPVCK